MGSRTIFPGILRYACLLLPFHHVEVVDQSIPTVTLSPSSVIITVIFTMVAWLSEGGSDYWSLPLFPSWSRLLCGGGHLSNGVQIFLEVVWASLLLWQQQQTESSWGHR